MTFDIDPYLQSHSAMTLQWEMLENGTSCRARSIRFVGLSGFFSYVYGDHKLPSVVTHDLALSAIGGSPLTTRYSWLVT